jgi:hypothetical protein
MRAGERSAKNRIMPSWRGFGKCCDGATGGDADKANEMAQRKVVTKTWGDRVVKKGKEAIRRAGYYKSRRDPK